MLSLFIVLETRSGFLVILTANMHNLELLMNYDFIIKVNSPVNVLYLQIIKHEIFLDSNLK